MADIDLSAIGCDKKVSGTNQITFLAQSCSCSSAPEFWRQQYPRHEGSSDR